MRERDMRQSLTSNSNRRSCAGSRFAIDTGPRPKICKLCSNLSERRPRDGVCAGCGLPWAAEVIERQSTGLGQGLATIRSECDGPSF